MANATATLKMLLLAEDHAGKVLKKVGVETDEAGKKHANMGKVAKAALLGVGVAAVGFANSSINKFKQVTAESRSLQRALGGTLEEASRMREAAILSGVDYGTFQKSVVLLDKNLVKATGNQKTAAAMTATLGMSFQDANGKVKPMGELLPQISEKFAAMKDGPEKSALALKLFGKSGFAMLPFLSKGKAGIADLEKESDKFGTTLKDGSIDALAKSREQTRLFTAGMDGLKVQIGAQLLPIMNKLIGFIQEYVIPVIQKITGFIREHKQAVMLAVIVIGTLIVGMKLWAIAQGILNVVMSANPIALVVIAIAALAAGLIYAYKHSETFRAVVQKAWAGIKVAIMLVWNYYLKPMFRFFKWEITTLATVVMWLWHNVIQPAWNGIAAVVRGAWHVIQTVFGWIKSGIHRVSDVVSAVAKGFGKVLGPVVAAFKWIWKWIDTICGWIFDRIQGIINAIGTAIDTVKSAIGILGGGTVTSGVTLGGSPPEHRAGGGPVIAHHPYIVGEHRPELFIPDRGGRIDPHPGRAGSSSPDQGSGHAGRHPLDRTHRTAQRGGDTYIVEFGKGVIFGTPAEVGREIGKALEYAANGGTRFHIKKAVV